MAFGGIGKALSRVGKAVSHAGKQTAGNLRHVNEAAVTVGQVGAFPVTASLASVSAGLTAARPVLGQASTILAENPALAGALGTAIGMPGLFGGGVAPGAGVFSGDPGGYAPAPASTGIPWWAWPAAGVALLLVLLALRKKKD